jgi:hypothetical protein
MGGISESKFYIDHANRVGVWNGQVRIVPSLQAPGFCKV